MVGCRDHPPAKAQFLTAAHGREGPFLEHLEQFDLHRRRDVADFIQENRAVRTAAREDSFVRLDRPGERPFAVPEQFGLDERFGVLREVQRDETARETLRETVLLVIVRNKTGAPDGGGGGAFSRAGLAEQQGGKLLHPVPEVAIVPADIMGENVVPQMAARFPHTGALAAQPVDEEEVGAARLKKNAEATGRLILRKPALRQQRQRLCPKSDPHRLVARADLFLDESVQLVIEAVEGLEEKHVSHHIAFLSRITAELPRAPAFQFPHLGGHGAPEELRALVLILESARDPAVQFEPLLAERVGEHRAGDPLPEFAVAPLGPGTVEPWPLTK